ncbi:MAG: ubiquinol-cytochrome C chaperone family protein [Pseudomonadota bacterium]
MLHWWQNRQQRMAAAQSLYALTVAAARRPALYAQYGIPDTFDGRFDSLLVHAAPVFTRLKDCDTPDSDALAQKYFDVIFKHMEISLREIGVGDLGVPKHVKKMMAAAQGRCLAYANALRTHDTADLQIAMNKNIFATAPVTDMQLTALSDMILTTYTHLSALDFATMQQADFTFSAPGETQWPKAA